MIQRIRSLSWIAAGLIVGLASGASGQDCEDRVFDSTYDLIQEVVFENRGCTNNACHGDAAAGGLVLTADVSYDSLVDQPAETVSDDEIVNLHRVVPGQKDQSLLFLNLAAATLPEQWQVPLRPMPIGLEPLTLNELEAVREWIEHGAPREGTVPGTAELLDACLPPSEPLPIKPLPAPEPGTGVQIRMPKWTVAPQTEDEVCFTSYFDVSDQVPEKYRGSVDGTFRFNLSQIRQDPLSHHLIVSIYTGDSPYDDPQWGPYSCRGGDKEGESCAPTDLEFCGDGLCASDPVSGAVCAGFGPPDRSTRQLPFTGIQEASAQLSFPPGAFSQVPDKGLIVWNSHAFNLTDVPGKSEAWMNFTFAEPDEQIFGLGRIFNTSSIFSMRVPVFEAQELCQHQVFPQKARLYEINSHTHQRGKRFRVFEGRFECQGGENAGAACSPLPDEGMDTDLCPGSECKARLSAPRGDCDLDGDVKINDLISCVNIASGAKDLSSCPDADPNGDGKVSVAELVTFVNDSFAPPAYRETPEDDVLYTNFVYNDPTVVLYDPPKPMEGSPFDRTLTYCSLYDNGFTDPGEVKQRTTSPESAGFLGGPCRTPTGCTEGLVGERCSGNNEQERNASCDTSPGAGDGFCDACTLRGGFTTEDEMFILMGSFYVDRR